MEIHDAETYQITLATLIQCMGKIMPFMKLPDVFEVYCNPDGRIWTISNKTGKTKTDVTLTPAEAMLIIKNVAAIDGRIIKDEDPSVDAKIPANSSFSMCRFHGDLPPIVENPVFNIRKHATTIFHLKDYVESGTMTQEQYNIVMRAIYNHKNIIVAGATGSGKTTFINAILAELAKTNERIISIEDTNELQCLAEDYVPMTASGKVTMSMCVVKTLRMKPNRIVVGEVRGPEALALFQAWSTGHKGGCCSVHSNSAVETLVRLVDMTSQVAVNPQPRTIANAVDIIIYIRAVGNHRWIEDIISIDGYDDVKKEFLWQKLDKNSKSPVQEGEAVSLAN